MRGDILWIYSDLDIEDNWTEAEHAWVLVVKLRGMSGGSLVFTKLYLMTFSADTLKESHTSTNINFMW